MSTTAEVNTLYEEFVANTIAVWYLRIAPVVMLTVGSGLLAQALRERGGPHGLPALFLTLFLLVLLVGIRWYRQSVVCCVSIAADHIVMDTVYWKRIVISRDTLQWMGDPVRRIGGIGADALEFARLDLTDGRHFSVMSCMDRLTGLCNSIRQIARDSF